MPSVRRSIRLLLTENAIQMQNVVQDLLNVQTQGRAIGRYITGVLSGHSWNSITCIKSLKPVSFTARTDEK